MLIPKKVLLETVYLPVQKFFQDLLGKNSFCFFLITSSSFSGKDGVLIISSIIGKSFSICLLRLKKTKLPEVMGENCCGNMSRENQKYLRQLRRTI